MNMRRISSLTSLLTFLITILTSVILYIVPHGRVAYWADWRLWGLTKEDWAGIHTNVGFLFLLALVVHVFYNWKAILLYLKTKSKSLRIVTPEFNVALLLTVICILGTYFGLPPFSTVLNISEGFKEAAIQKYGEPPYGHAELSSLKTFTKKTNLDLDKAMVLLATAGYKFDSAEMTLKEVAERHGISPQDLYKVMKSAERKNEIRMDAVTGKVLMPEEPVPGTGRLTLADLCSQYGINMKQVTRHLKEQGLEAEVSDTIKKIGEKNDLNPTDVYLKIRAVQYSE